MQIEKDPFPDNFFEMNPNDLKDCLGIDPLRIAHPNKEKITFKTGFLDSSNCEKPFSAFNDVIEKQGFEGTEEFNLSFESSVDEDIEKEEKVIEYSKTEKQDTKELLERELLDELNVLLPESSSYASSNGIPIIQNFTKNYFNYEFLEDLVEFQEEKA